MRPIPVELRELSLVSVAPITVNCASGDQEWDVRVSFSAEGAAAPRSALSPSSMLITHTEEAGGTWEATVHVCADLEFTRVSDSLRFTIDACEVLSLRAQVALKTESCWSHDPLEEALEVDGITTNFFPGSGAACGLGPTSAKANPYEVSLCPDLCPDCGCMTEHEAEFAAHGICPVCPIPILSENLVMCPEMQFETTMELGQEFPWEDSTFFFATFRNRYLYPSTTLLDLQANDVETIESMHARTTSFSTTSVNVYGSLLNGTPSTVVISEAVADNLMPTFALNTAAPELGRLEGTDANPIVIEIGIGLKGSLLSTCTSCPDGDKWFDPIELANHNNLLVDMTLSVAPGTSGNTLWDTSTTALGIGCPEPERAFGSGSFVNFNHLTTAFDIDDNVFVWVFDGIGPAPPCLRLDGQVEQSIQLLVTPGGLEAAGLAGGSRDRRRSGKVG